MRLILALWAFFLVSLSAGCQNSKPVKDTTDPGEDTTGDTPTLGNGMPMQCPSAVICGTPPMCCAVGSECVDDQCLPACTTGVRCGAEATTCCGNATQVCLANVCVEPGASCTDSFDCPENFFCEPTLGKCLPQQDPLVCQVTPVFGAFGVTSEFEVSSAPTGEEAATSNCMHPISAPVVVDLDGDSVPEIIVAMACSGQWRKGVLRAYRGNGTHLWSVTAEADWINGRSGIAAGDLTGDGVPEIVAVAQVAANPNTTDECRLLAFKANGERLWASTLSDGVTPLALCMLNSDLNGAPALADLEGDGSPEVIYGALVLDAAGKLKWSQNNAAREGSNGGYNGGLSAVGDIDDDGKLEVVAGRRVYEHDGAAKAWTLGATDGYPAIANFDADVQPEIVLVANGTVSYFDGSSGVLEWGPVAIPTTSAGNNRGGPPTIADFDGDGKPEIGVAGGTSYSVLDPERVDLNYVLWSRPTTDLSSNATGSSVFDFEGDGIAEVVYQDECYVRTYRGTDGEVLLQIPNTSATIHEYPLVADVDADGNSEIVIVANNWSGSHVNTCKTNHPADYPASSTGRNGLFVYGDQNDQWVRTRRVWNQHAYHVTNITPQGVVPAVEVKNWTLASLNNYRQNVQGEGIFNAADLKVLGLDVVLTGCPTSLTLRARIGNAGSLGAPAGILVAFRSGLPGSGGALLGVATTTAAILPGGSTVVTFDVALQGEPPYDFSAAVNDDGSGSAGALVECDGGNNDGSIGGIRCGSFLL